jgi:hypothetical protein
MRTGEWKNELSSLKTHDFKDGTAPAAPIKDKSAVLRRRLD